MSQKLYQVDAFAENVFSGNPAAVCPLKEWLPDEVMQKIAMENNLAETAFYVKTGNQYELRWFTPAVEVDLCGHATLAAAFVLFNHENHNEDAIQFFSHKSGILTVTKKGDLLTLNFPSDTIKEIAITEDIRRGFDKEPRQALKGKTDYLLLFEKEADIVSVKPNFSEIKKMEARGVIITAKGDAVDFVSRFFGPQVGIDEDPVTGSAHTTLIPYWAEQLQKIELSAIQLSARRGYLTCRHLGDRVEISGKGKLYLIGEIFIK
ncbi:MAG: PhzF family phenazine biosynthesis protein [Cyclobacteriaceae bacterium]